MGVDHHDNRAISNPRRTAIWTVLHAGCRAAEEETLPELEPELWLLIFTFLKKDRVYAPRPPRSSVFFKGVDPFGSWSSSFSRFRALRGEGESLRDQIRL